MARLSRLVVPGVAHHLAHRTVAGTELFADAAELRLFKEALQRASREQQVLLHAYAMQPLGIQLLATPPRADSLSQMMQALARFYVPALNRRRGRTGAIWQGRFCVAPVGGAEPLLTCMRYIEQPVGVADPAGVIEPDSPQSSANAHCGGPADTLLAPVPSASGYWQLGNTPFEREAAYRRLLDSGLNADGRHAIEASTLKGWAFGTGEFLASLRGAGFRRAGPAPPGRPRRAPRVETAVEWSDPHS